MICADNYCGPDREILAEKESEVLQLGPIYYLPCTSRVFSSVSCSFALSPDGTLKSIGSAHKAAAAEVGVGALNAALDSAAAMQTTMSTARRRQLEFDTAAEKAQADYNAAVATNASAAQLLETSTAKATVEWAQAKKAEADALAALEQTRAATGVDRQ